MFGISAEIVPRQKMKPALSLNELDVLGDFLAMNDGSDDRLAIVACEGFFAALHSGPKLVKPDEWLPIVLGTTPPKYASEDEAKTLMSLLMRFYNEVGARLVDSARDFEPRIGDQNGELSLQSAVLWAVGYMRAVALRAKDWGPLVNSADGAILSPIFDLALYIIKTSPKRLNTKTNRRLAGKLADSVMDVFEYWYGCRKSVSL